MKYPKCHKCTGTITKKETSTSDWRLVWRKREDKKVAYHHKCALWGWG